MEKKIRAFTLVELLVVISIIAVLLAVLLPVLTRSRQIAYRTICLNNLRQLGLATEAYTQSYKYYPLCVTQRSETWSDFLAKPDIAKNKTLGVPVSLWPFYKDKKIYDCPVLTKLGCDISYCYNWTAGRDLSVNGTAFALVVPSDMPPPKPPVQEEEKANLHLLNPEKVKSPAIFVLLYDQPIKPEGIAAGNNDPYKDIDPDDYNDPSDNGQTQGHLWKYKNPNDALGPHNNGDNILFADGHVNLQRKIKEWPDPSISRKPN
jgi:prepilin-type N-terminal cleavage/methylation domain-containing protein/prepilin-type processing-associated H-X9-DG protein